MLHCKGGLISEISVDLPKPRPPYRTSEDTVSLIGRLAVHYDDSMIAKVLNQQQRRTATIDWVRDLDIDEDRSQFRTDSGPPIMGSFRNLAITILRLTDATCTAASLHYHARQSSRAPQIL